jgi:hypothetical protein
MSRDVALGYFEELMRPDPDELQAAIEQTAAAISVPCLLVFGERLTCEERAYTLAHLAEAQIEERDRRGHFVHLAEVDWFVTRLRTFINSCQLGQPAPTVSST